MLRKLILLVIGVAIVGLAAFYIVTIPATVPASALGSHTPDLANGKEISLRVAAPRAMRRPDRTTRRGSAVGSA